MPPNMPDASGLDVSSSADARASGRSSPPTKSRLHLHARHASAEYLSPDLQSHHRQSTLYGAVCSLTATILGGGILSLPFCFELCGLVGGTLLMILLAVASDFSVYILISCSRRIRHGASYEEVVESTFGRSCGRLVVFAMLGLVYVCVVAYVLLVRDLASPLLELMLGVTFSDAGRLLLVGVVLCVLLPICLHRDMHALQWTASISIGAMIVLAYCVLYRGLEAIMLEYREPHHARFQDGGLKLLPSSWSDAFYAGPIFASSFVCQFNVLPLHRELIRPTRPRIKKMINWVILFCSCLYLTVGIFGYVFARGFTDGNILNNLRVHDPLAVIARAALSFCVISGLPMIVLPARQLTGKILQMVTSVGEGRHEIVAGPNSSSHLHPTSESEVAHDPLAASLQPAESSRSPDTIDAHDPLEPAVDSDSEVEEAGRRAMRRVDVVQWCGTGPDRSAPIGPCTDMRSPHSHIVTINRTSEAPAEETPLLLSRDAASAASHATPTRSYTDADPQALHATHAMTAATRPSLEANFSDRAIAMQTIAILLSAMVLSSRVRSVALLWNLAGSSVCLLIGFILPSACYLKIRRDKPIGVRMGSAWAMLLLGIIGLVICTLQSVSTLATITAAPKADEGVAPNAV